LGAAASSWRITRGITAAILPAFPWFGADNFSVIRSPPFSFHVGEDRTCLTIHVGVVQNISEPLNALINNGRMKESTSGTAVLGDVDEDVFIGFCKYAYTGSYDTPDQIPDSSPRPESPEPDNQSVRSAEEEPTAEAEPPLEPPELSIEPEFLDTFWGRKRRETWSEEPEAPPPDDTDYYYERLWMWFSGLEYTGPPASVSLDPDILFHAKLYVFATRYIVDGLRTQCLKSLHRDLCAFPLNKANVSQILALLEFTYNNTARKEPGGRSRLRDLVIHYVACKAPTLADDENLSLLLDSNGEMGSDLVAKLVK
jgi:hypothetical protein